MEENVKADSETKEKISFELKKRDIDLAHQLAFMESGISVYSTDSDICRDYCITREELAMLRNKLRGEVEKFKEEHRYGKYRIMMEIHGRIGWIELIRKALENNDMKTYEQLKEASKMLNAVAPDEKLRSLIEILKEVDDFPVPGVSPSGSNSVNIQINSPVVNELQELLDKKKRQSAEEKEEKKDGAVDLPKEFVELNKVGSPI